MPRNRSRQSNRRSARRMHLFGWLTALGVTAPVTVGMAQDSAAVAHDSTPAAITPLATGDSLRKEPLPQTHTVRKGDTLWDLARFYGVSVDRLRTVNKLSGDVILPGRTLLVPGKP